MKTLKIRAFSIIKHGFKDKKTPPKPQACQFCFNCWNVTSSKYIMYIVTPSEMKEHQNSISLLSLFIARSYTVIIMCEGVLTPIWRIQISKIYIVKLPKIPWTPPPPRKIILICPWASVDISKRVGRLNPVSSHIKHSALCNTTELKSLIFTMYRQ